MQKNISTVTSDSLRIVSRQLQALLHNKVTLLSLCLVLPGRAANLLSHHVYAILIFHIQLHSMHNEYVATK